MPLTPGTPYQRTVSLGGSQVVSWAWGLNYGSYNFPGEPFPSKLVFHVTQDRGAIHANCLNKFELINVPVGSGIGWIPVSLSVNGGRPF